MHEDKIYIVIMK